MESKTWYQVSDECVSEPREMDPESKKQSPEFGGIRNLRNGIRAEAEPEIAAGGFLTKLFNFSDQMLK